MNRAEILLDPSNKWRNSTPEIEVVGNSEWYSTQTESDFKNQFKQFGSNTLLRGAITFQNFRNLYLRRGIPSLIFAFFTSINYIMITLTTSLVTELASIPGMVAAAEVAVAAELSCNWGSCKTNPKLMYITSVRILGHASLVDLKCNAGYLLNIIFPSPIFLRYSHLCNHPVH